MIEALITDFDGTLVNTFEANFKAYQEAFEHVGIKLTKEIYNECFGFRFDGFMQAVGVKDIDVSNTIREIKKKAYPHYFSELKVNVVLLDFIERFHNMGGKTAIASTASKENLFNAVTFLGISPHFDVICAGNDVKQGKPSPEIYIKAMDVLNVDPNKTLIFEDSPVGLEAVSASGAQYVKIDSCWFD